MFLAQEIYYTTTGNYKMRKSMYLVYQVNSRNANPVKYLDRHELEQLSQVVILPSLNVTPKEFKFHNDKSGKRF